ncbi:MAG TPA: carboxypeptidase-like regulatory domain-containing protein, partial [Novosphingobium sp.]
PASDAAEDTAKAKPTDLAPHRVANPPSPAAAEAPVAPAPEEVVPAAPDLPAVSTQAAPPAAGLRALVPPLRPREPLLGVAAGGAPAPANVATPPSASANDNSVAPTAPLPQAHEAAVVAPDQVPGTHPARVGSAARAGKGIATPPRPAAGFADEDELILELTTPDHAIDATIVAYSRHGAPYLPLGELARQLDLAVTVSDAGHYAAGWVLEPGKTLTLNLRDGTVVAAGKARSLAPDDAVAFDGELYLRADRYGDILPLTLTTNLRAQTVTVQTRVPFPFQQRAARETAREQLRGRQARRDGRQFERLVAPWRAIDLPLIDTELRAASDTLRGPRGEADVRVAGDFAWLTARAFLSMDSQGGATGARLELGRRDPDARLLGPLRATEFGVGDITSAPLPLGLASVAGRGLFVTNAPLEQASVFDRIELRGELPDGYEAELYRNNILIDTAAAPQDGQYRFLNIPVEFGLNVFRVVLYGPQGQRREVIRQISVGDGRLGAGAFQYGFGTVQRNQSLFALHGRDSLPGPDDGALRTTAEVRYGFSGGLTGTAGGAVYERLGHHHWLATGGLRSGLAGFAVKLDLALADQSGRAYGLGLARKLGGFSVTLNHGEYRGTFVDEVRAFSDQPLRRVTEVTVNGSLALGGKDSAWRIPINGIARDIQFADGHEVQSAALTQALPLSRALQLTHLIEFDRTRAPLFGTGSQLRGAFDLASLSRSSLQLRGSLGYALLPAARLTSAAVQVSRRIGERATVSATAGRNFQSDQSLFGLSAIRRFDRFALALEGNYGSNPGRYAALLRLSFSLGRNPLDGRLFTAPSGLATGGAVAIHAFRDLDGDGRYEPGEPPVGDVRFFAGAENSATDTQGRVLLGRLGDGPRTSVRIDRDTLPDISMAPVADGVELVPRAGRIVVHDFAIRALGELDGTAWFDSPTGAKPVSGVIVLLIDEQGQTAARVRTGSDGSFWFEKLSQGSYRLALDAGQAARLGIALIAPEPVHVGPDGPSLRQNLHIRSLAKDNPQTNG